MDSEASASFVSLGAQLNEGTHIAEVAGQSPASSDLSGEDLQVSSDGGLNRDIDDQMSVAVIEPATAVETPMFDDDAALQGRIDTIFKGSHVAYWQQKLCKVHNFEFKYTQLVNCALYCSPNEVHEFELLYLLH